MKLKIICRYCDYSRIGEWYSKPKSLTCDKCNSRDLTIRDYEDTVVDYYVGCFPFPKKRRIDTEEEILTFYKDYHD